MLDLNRRSFLKAAGAAATVETFLGARTHLLAEAQTEQAKPVAANDHIQFALIGAGGQGQGDTKVAVQVPGVKLVAVADCYDGRLQHSKELWGDDIFTTRDYAQILERKDIDAVIIGTPDHWHKQVAVDAMKAGKDVYCEKPMIHLYADGPQMIEAAHASHRILQVGSQRVSSVIYAKAKELLASGAIGQLNMVTARWDRNSSIGAWNYTVPLDASTESCDWPRFLGTAPVHLFSGTHFITGAHGPTRAMASGGLRFWKDGRDVPDVMLGLFDYPEGFNLSLRVNFVDGGEENEGLIFTGSEGTMEIAGNSVIVSRTPLEKGPGLFVGSFTEAMQKKITEEYYEKYPREHPMGAPQLGYEKYVAAAGYSDSYDHFRNFFSSVRSRQPVGGHETGLRVCGTPLAMENLSQGVLVNVADDGKGIELELK